MNTQYRVRSTSVPMYDHTVENGQLSEVTRTQLIENLLNDTQQSKEYKDWELISSSIIPVGGLTPYTISVYMVWKKND